MKKLLVILAVMFSIEALAFDGTANGEIEGWKIANQFHDGDYKNFDNEDWMNLSRAQGFVSGVSTLYGYSDYIHPICYPKDSNVNQLLAVAADYILANPAAWDRKNAHLVWEAHYEAWGDRARPECWMFEMDNAL